jgi:hypothetical protein
LNAKCNQKSPGNQPLPKNKGLERRMCNDEAVKGFLSVRAKAGVIKE